MTGLRLVLATANPAKVAEISQILEDAAAEIVLVPRPTSVPEVVEDGETLEANARLKADALTRATGEVAVADDTGLEVDVLDGAPGVGSARYGGPDGDAEANVRRLLTELEAAGAAGEQRAARFRTVALARWPDGREVLADGTVEGRISVAPRGAGGFGYDPVFVPTEGDGRTFAEMTADEKHAISHRGRAFRYLAELLAAV